MGRVADWRREIDSAGRRIAGHVRLTPALRLDGLVEGRTLEVKLEQLQHTGSFKPRGAFNSLLSQTVPEAGVVAASGGNHGAAVAFAARALGHRARIFVPDLAGPSKIALIRSTGVTPDVVPGAYPEALVAARAFEAESGAIQIHAYDAVPTVAGQGTVFAEWEAQGLNADTILVAVGGGGLIAGALAWFGNRRRVVAVEPETAPTLNAALAAGAPVDVEVGGIAANALGARRIGKIAFQLASGAAARSILVSDDAIADAQRLLWTATRQLVEPGGATALAALISGAYRPAPDERVAVLVCGGNIDPDPFR